LGTSIVLTALLGSLAGAFFVYHIARSKGSKVVKYLPVLDSTRFEKASKVLSRSSFPAVTLGRLLPGMMLPVSLVAGMMHFPLLSFMAGVFVQLCLWVLCFLFLGNTAEQIIPVPVLVSPSLIDRVIPVLLICGGIAVIVYLVNNKRSFHTESSLTPH
jgi:membrane protein DedA with SNARE-associated domain